MERKSEARLDYEFARGHYRFQQVGFWFVVAVLVASIAFFIQRLVTGHENWLFAILIAILIAFAAYRALVGWFRVLPTLRREMEETQAKLRVEEKEQGVG